MSGNARASGADRERRGQMSVEDTATALRAIAIPIPEAAAVREAALDEHREQSARELRSAAFPIRRGVTRAAWLAGNHHGEAPGSVPPDQRSSHQ